MPVTAMWPRTRRERTLAARCLRIGDALRHSADQQSRLREELRVVRAERDLAVDLGRWLVAEARWRARTPVNPRQEEIEQLRRLTLAQADRLDAAQREIGQLEATIVRLRPSLMRREP